MGLLHLNLHKCRSRPVPPTGNDHNVIISHNTIKESLQSSSSNNIRLKLNRQLMEQLCYLRLIRDLVRSASLAVPLTLFTLLRTKTFFNPCSPFTQNSVHSVTDCCIVCRSKKRAHVNERRIRAIFCRFINLPGTV